MTYNYLIRVARNEAVRNLFLFFLGLMPVSLLKNIKFPYYKYLTFIIIYLVRAFYLAVITTPLHLSDATLIAAATIRKLW